MKHSLLKEVTSVKMAENIINTAKVIVHFTLCEFSWHFLEVNYQTMEILLQFYVKQTLHSASNAEVHQILI